VFTLPYHQSQRLGAPVGRGLLLVDFVFAANGIIKAGSQVGIQRINCASGPVLSVTSTMRATKSFSLGRA
jgi:hypothetical protein